MPTRHRIVSTALAPLQDKLGDLNSSVSLLLARAQRGARQLDGPVPLDAIDAYLAEVAEARRMHAAILETLPWAAGDSRIRDLRAAIERTNLSLEQLRGNASPSPPVESSLRS